MKQDTRMTIVTEFEEYEFEGVLDTEHRRLTGIQEYAIDLYQRGFNVFPIPSATDWLLHGEEKKPYLLEPLYRNRMHYAKYCLCKTCIRYNFLNLFEDSNIAVMCGATSGNLIAVDCDSHRAFKEMGLELVGRGLEFWAYSSHRGGSYLLRVLEGEISNIDEKKSKFENVQIWGFRHFMVIPPSIHPEGTVYAWVSPEPLNMLRNDTLRAVSVDELKWLGVKLKKNNQDELEDLSGLPEYAKELTYINRHTLQFGAEKGGRNTALSRLAAELVGIGLDDEEVRYALETTAYKCTPVYDDRSHRIEPILKWAFSKERTPTRKLYGKTDGVQNWQQAQKFASQFDWRGAFGGSATYARRVFEACTKRASLDCRSTVFRAAAREIAELARINKETASKYLRMLELHDLLVHTDTEKSRAKVFKFGQRIMAVQCSPIDILLYGNCPTKYNTLPENDVEYDAFYGLGTYAYRIWRELLVRPARNGNRLAKRLSLNSSTVRATLARLLESGLVHYSQGECLYHGNAVTTAQLERIAVNRGTLNKARKKDAQANLEREKYVNRWLGNAKAYYKSKNAELRARGR